MSNTSLSWSITTTGKFLRTPAVARRRLHTQWSRRNTPLRPVSAGVDHSCSVQASRCGCRPARLIGSRTSSSGMPWQHFLRYQRVAHLSFRSSASMAQPHHSHHLQSFGMCCYQPLSCPQRCSLLLCERRGPLHQAKIP